MEISMLMHPTHERLIALGLTRMAEALEEQRRSSDLAALSRWAELTIRSRRPSDCLWTATWCNPWRTRTSPAAAVTATRSQ